MQIHGAETNDDWQMVLGIEEVVLATGYRKALARTSLANRHEIISSLVDYHCMTKMKAVMDQFKEGLAVLGVLKSIQENPHWWQPLFVTPDIPLTASEFRIL